MAKIEEIAIAGTHRARPRKPQAGNFARRPEKQETGSREARDEPIE